MAVSFEYITEILDSIKDEEHALSSQIVIALFHVLPNQTLKMSRHHYITDSESKTII